MTGRGVNESTGKKDADSPEACSTTSSALLTTALTALPSNPTTAYSATSTKLSCKCVPPKLWYLPGFHKNSHTAGSL